MSAFGQLPIPDETPRNAAVEPAGKTSGKPQGQHAGGGTPLVISKSLALRRKVLLSPSPHSQQQHARGLPAARMHRQRCVLAFGILKTLAYVYMRLVDMQHSAHLQSLLTGTPWLLLSADSSRACFSGS